MRPAITFLNIQLSNSRMALLLRTGINVTASLYTVVCNVVYDKLHGKRAEIAENLVKP